MIAALVVSHQYNFFLLLTIQIPFLAPQNRNNFFFSFLISCLLESDSLNVQLHLAAGAHSHTPPSQQVMRAHFLTPILLLTHIPPSRRKHVALEPCSSTLYPSITTCPLSALSSTIMTFLVVATRHSYAPDLFLHTSFLQLLCSLHFFPPSIASPHHVLFLCLWGRLLSPSVKLFQPSVSFSVTTAW